jgi:hypothetical protein
MHIRSLPVLHTETHACHSHTSSVAVYKNRQYTQMSDNPPNNSYAPVADTNLKPDNVSAPEVERKGNPNALRRAVKTWLDMLVPSTSGKS